ncbi:MAG TPA: CDP-alcohol phosphatidyltransferase family protein [Acidiferrobacteraceae bacterium]|nr:CDP-alcohol phosphatidyltransferase family protein [Acidiferrobacteraceae bacterium]
MGNLQGNLTYRRFIYPNWANAVSILGVLPLALLFIGDGYRYLIPLIIFNNVMDDLDGILAAKLDIRSQFGADLDNVCDAVAHVVLVLALSAHFGGLILMMGMIAAVSIILRVTSRLNSNAASGCGSPTNELMRHMLFVLLLTKIFKVDPGFYLALIFVLHSLTMIVPFKLTVLVRGLAKTAVAVAFVNVALVAAWLMPTVTLPIAVAFFATYLYSFVVGGGQWLRDRGTKSLRQ